MRKHIILHTFLWKVQDIIKNLETIKASGYTAIQLSPCQKCKEGGEWWNVYQNLGFEIGNKYGTKSDIKELCSKAHSLGIKVIVDIVVNHCANEGGSDLELVPHHNVPKELSENKFFWKEKQSIRNWDNRYQVTNYSSGLPKLNLSNWDLQDIIIKFLNELIDIGVDGFRIDSGKAISLYEEDKNTFWTRVFDNLHRKEELYNYAELIFCETELLNKYSQYINVLSNCYCKDKTRLVTFFMSHDSDLEFGYTKKMNDNMIVNEWGILLSSNRESSMLFYCRPFNDLWKSREIRNINLELR